MPSCNLQLSVFRSFFPFYPSFLLFILPAFASAQDPLAGRPGATQALDVSPRSQALGGIGVALEHSSTLAAFWNPALSAFAPAPQLSVGYKRLSLGRNQQFIGYTQPVQPRAGLSAALISHGDLEIDVYDQDENLSPDRGYFLAADLILSLSYKINRRLSVGLATQLMYETLADAEHGESVFDVGNLGLSCFYRITNHLTAGANLMNLGAALDWLLWDRPSDYEIPQTDILPTVLKTGFCYQNRVSGHQILAGLDLDFIRQYPIYFGSDSITNDDPAQNPPDWAYIQHFGGEFYVMPILPVRLGMKINQLRDPFIFRWSTGLGLAGLGKRKNQYVDYVFEWEPNGSGTNHGLAWSVQF
jgi:hypothetical protein